MLQAVEEVLATMEPVFAKHPEMIDVMERLVEPERMVAFRVAWVDDKGKQQARVLPARLTCECCDSRPEDLNPCDIRPRICMASYLMAYMRPYMLCWQYGLRLRGTC